MSRLLPPQGSRSEPGPEHGERVTSTQKEDLFPVGKLHPVFSARSGFENSKRITVELSCRNRCVIHLSSAGIFTSE